MNNVKTLPDSLDNLLVHPTPTHTVTLYDCRDMASGYSECIAVRMGSEFACGWCGGSCEVMQECSNTFVTEGINPPPPVINSFTPMSGKNAVSV